MPHRFRELLHSTQPITSVIPILSDYLEEARHNLEIHKLLETDDSVEYFRLDRIIIEGEILLSDLRLRERNQSGF